MCDALTLDACGLCGFLELKDCPRCGRKRYFVPARASEGVAEAAQILVTRVLQQRDLDAADALFAIVAQLPDVITHDQRAQIVIALRAGVD